MASLRPMLLGGLGGAGGVLVTQWLTGGSLDLTYQEPPGPLADPSPSPQPPVVPSPPPSALASGRAGEILRFGAPVEGLGQPLVYSNHVLSYDAARRVPRWVAEHLSREVAARPPVASRKGVNFGPDPQVALRFASHNKDYWGSGWSRGHMAPAGNNKHCQASMGDTFYLTNIVPQDLDNNGNYWNRLEIWCRGLTAKYQDVWVTSGPLWLPEGPPKTKTEEVEVKEEKKDVKDEEKQEGKRRRVRPPRPPTKRVTYPVIGRNEVAVPTHLYKVVVAYDPSLATPLLAAFVVPNRPVQDTHLTEFAVELEELEHHAGLTFHPALARGELGSLCRDEGCHLQDYREFQEFFWRRRLASPWNLQGLERDWAEAARKGMATPAMELVYREARARLEAKEAEGRQTEVKETPKEVVVKETATEGVVKEQTLTEAKVKEGAKEVEVELKEGVKEPEPLVEGKEESEREAAVAA